MTVETFTIIHDRQGPSKVIASLLDTAGVRSWGSIEDEETVRGLSGKELIGREGMLSDDGVLTLL